MVDSYFFQSERDEQWFVGLTDGPCDTQNLAETVTDPKNGAIAQFLGVVRNHNDGLSAQAVDYDVHPELAMKALKKLAIELTAVYPVRLMMVHSRGLVSVGEASVVIAASSAHRKDALSAVADAIDLLKVRVPIWKREIAPDESHRWLDGHSLRQD